MMIIKKILLIYLLLLLYSCKQKNNKQDVSNTGSLQTFSVTKATLDDFLKAKNNYKDKILFDTVLYKKENGVIKLPTEEKWRPFIIFTDTLIHTDDDRIREYKYLGQFDKIGFYIVCGSFWEHYECYLIDKITGRETTIWNDPRISPDDKFIANLSMPYGLEGVPNGIQIWKVAKQEHNEAEPTVIEKHLELDQQIWAPSDFFWETDNSIILKVASITKYEGTGPKDIDFYYLRLIIR